MLRQHHPGPVRRHPRPHGRHAPEVGSVFEVDNYGHGYELVYSDLVGAGTGGQNLYTDTLVTPFGDYTIPTSYDAASVLANESSASPTSAASSSSMLADLAHLFGSSSAASAEPASALDTGSLAEMFPHLATALDGGSLADLFPNLAAAFDPSTFADVFPHVDAALNLLTGLF